MKLVDGSLTLKQSLSFFFFLFVRHLCHQVFTVISFGLFPPLASFKYDAEFSAHFPQCTPQGICPFMFL